ADLEEYRVAVYVRSESRQLAVDRARNVLGRAAGVEQRMVPHAPQELVIHLRVKAAPLLARSAFQPLSEFLLDLVVLQDLFFGAGTRRRRTGTGDHCGHVVLPARVRCADTER